VNTVKTTKQFSYFKHIFNQNFSEFFFKIWVVRGMSSFNKFRISSFNKIRISLSTSLKSPCWVKPHCSSTYNWKCWFITCLLCWLITSWIYWFITWWLCWLVWLCWCWCWFLCIFWFYVFEQVTSSWWYPWCWSWVLSSFIRTLKNITEYLLRVSSFSKILKVSSFSKILKVSSFRTSYLRKILSWILSIFWGISMFWAT